MPAPVVTVLVQQQLIPGTMSSSSERDPERPKDTLHGNQHHQDQGKKGEVVVVVSKDESKACEEARAYTVKKSSSKENEASSKSVKLSCVDQSSDGHKRNAAAASMDDCECAADTGEAADVPRKKRRLSSEHRVDCDSIHKAESSGLTVHQLVEHVKTVNRKGLHREYYHIRAEPSAGTFTHSRARQNLPKNRYTDVLCYDHSRVTLSSTAGVTTGDYIHANLVDGYMQKNAYICTQGPLPKTTVDFWRMVWQYQSRVIVMTTRTTERQRLKCAQYWPHVEHVEEQFQELRVTNQSVKVFHNYVDTILMLCNTTTGESREIRHLQFIAWPDFGVPPAAGFLDFLFLVRQVQETATRKMGSEWTGNPGGPPVVVHCSAGIGRTGTFVTIDISLRRLEDVGTVDIPMTVQRIRSQRASSIQTPDQYVFCHLAVIEHAIRAGQITNVDSFALDSSDSDSE